MSVRSTVARAKRAADSIMLDTCRITRTATPDDPEWVAQVIDEVTGQYPPQGRVLVYEGRCRMQVKADINSNVVETTAGEHEFTYLTAQLQLPIAGTADVAVDHIAEWLTSPDDDALTGRLFNITGPYHKSQAGYRRFRIREVVA